MRHMQSLRAARRSAALLPVLRPVWQTYAEATPRPLYCLLFLFPLIATYEFGALLLRPLVWPERQLVAHSVIQQCLSWFGAYGAWLPALALVLTLLGWQILGRFSWRVRPWVFAGMTLESLVLTVPLLVLGQVMLQAGGPPAGDDPRAWIVLSLGAAVYEELVFRFALIFGAAQLLQAAFGWSRSVGLNVALVGAALIFAGCHFTPVGSEPFTWKHFILLTTAGGYLGLVFVHRGLGISTGCHAAFNLLGPVFVAA